MESAAIDLAGCGDSAGDFGDATWDIWLADLAAAWDWLSARDDGAADGAGVRSRERWVWGMRLGALLAASFAADCRPATSGLVLWQPVASGSQHLNQFLRLRTVQGLLSESSGESLQSLRAALTNGRSVEVAGYRLAPGLALPMGGAELAKLNAVPPEVVWLDVSSQQEASAPAGSATLSPAASRVVERWRALGANVQTAVVTGPAFWQTLEIEACPALVEATESMLALRTEARSAGRHELLHRNSAGLRCSGRARRGRLRFPPRAAGSGC